MSYITIAGNIVDEYADLRYSGSGSPWCKFTVAVNRKENDEWVSSFYRCKMFGEQAEYFAESAVQGSRVMITGRMQEEHWENKDGEKRSGWVLMAQEGAMSTKYYPALPQKPERTDT